MKLIELHIIQSFPVSCLNRDDVGAPKTAIFGGSPRARISSQCLKRAIRELAKEMSPRFTGKRSQWFADKLTSELKELKIDVEIAGKLAKCAIHYLGTLDSQIDMKAKTLMFLSPSELKSLAQCLSKLGEHDRDELCKAVDGISAKELEKDDDGSSEELDEEETKRKSKLRKKFTVLVSNKLKPTIKKALGNGVLKDAADIAIFGRMIASDHSLTIEGAGMFSHALSTHKASNDIDFFAAMEEFPEAEQSGAAMIQTLEFTSATYYRYVGLNLDLLFRDDHLGVLAPIERKEVIETFLRAAILAVPNGRKNSMNAHTLPGYVLGLVKNGGQPLQLINAFEKPGTSTNGLLDDSVHALKEHHEKLKKTWGISIALEKAIPDTDFNTFCKEIADHVL